MALERGNNSKSISPPERIYKYPNKWLNNDAQPLYSYLSSNL